MKSVQIWLSTGVKQPQVQGLSEQLLHRESVAKRSRFLRDCRTFYDNSRRSSDVRRRIIMEDMLFRTSRKLLKSSNRPTTRIEFWRCC